MSEGLLQPLEQLSNNTRGSLFIELESQMCSYLYIRIWPDEVSFPCQQVELALELALNWLDLEE